MANEYDSSLLDDDDPLHCRSRFRKPNLIVIGGRLTLLDGPGSSGSDSHGVGETRSVDSGDGDRGRSADPSTTSHFSVVGCITDISGESSVKSISTGVEGRGLGGGELLAVSFRSRKTLWKSMGSGAGA